MEVAQSDQHSGPLPFVLQNGAPAEPPTLSSAVPNWRTGDTIHLGKRTLRVIGERDDDADQPPVLVIEDVGQKSV